MTRKLFLAVAVLALLCATGAVQASATPKTVAKPSKHTTTYTAKQKFRTHDGTIVTGIRTGTGRVFTGVDKVTETIDPTPTVMAPDSASALDWQRVAYVQDEATWTGSGDGYYYTLAVAAAIGWQAQPDGRYFTAGPYQYRQNPSCFRQLKTGGDELATSCNFAWYSSALEAKACEPTSSCTIDAPWGFRDFYQPSTVSILFAGNWHSLSGTPYAFGNASLLSFTGDATARFIKPNHLTRIYCTGSFWWSVLYHTAASDFCTGMTAIN